ncbi:MAG: non-heme iron oxygenase ferredoxin subunit [Actinomycetota bacterium]|nr:non-heme iron oxygenase ferredoxin subunit [Actinomycetota bacterium]
MPEAGERRERLCSTGEVEPDSARRFEVGRHKIALVRVGDDFYAIGDTCSHADYSLSEGEVDPATCQIECWKHGSSFDLKTGEPDSLPATKPVPTYDVMVEGDEVWVVVDG